MISNIIDSNGILVFTGNDVDSKFATVLARAGHSRVDIPSPFRESKWDGSKWINNEQPPTYAKKRKEEYPDIGEQLDMLWHAMDTGVLPKVDSFYDTIKITKDKYPKE
tara:strand:+ start:864 stop:1187 length:324 start_codon:yes stop_codon:yes gene_type:complete